MHVISDCLQEREVLDNWWDKGQVYDTFLVRPVSMVM